MRNRVVSILPNVTSRVLAITIFTTLQGVTVLAADHCITKPDFRATQGGHWYYHFDAVKNHKCWFLREQGVQARQVLQESPSSAEAVPESNSSLYHRCWLLHRLQSHENEHRAAALHPTPLMRSGEM